MTFTSRERVEAAINFQKPDRLPFNFWMDRRRMAELDRKHGNDFRIVHFGADVWESCIPILFPTGQFEFKYGTSWLVKPLFEDWAETKSIPMPDPDDPSVVAQLNIDLERFRDRAVIANLANVLTYGETMVRQEDLYIEMCLHPERVNDLFHRISSVLAQVAERVCKLDIAALYVQDDVACNKGLLISPNLFREVVLPHWKKVIDVAHEHDKPVFFHTDGRVDALWSVFAQELGVRMLNPLQPELQDLRDFKQRYHGAMGCYGGLHTARIHLMREGEIARHVRDLFETVGAQGGLIASTHDIDYSATDRQIEALVGAIKECRY